MQLFQSSPSQNHAGELTRNGASLPAVVGPAPHSSTPPPVADIHQDILDPISLRYGTTAYGWGDHDANDVYDLPGKLFGFDVDQT